MQSVKRKIGGRRGGVTLKRGNQTRGTTNIANSAICSWARVYSTFSQIDTLNSTFFLLDILAVNHQKNDYLAGVYIVMWMARNPAAT